MAMEGDFDRYTTPYVPQVRVGGGPEATYQNVMPEYLSQVVAQPYMQNGVTADSGAANMEALLNQYAQNVQTNEEFWKQIPESERWKYEYTNPDGTKGWRVGAPGLNLVENACLLPLIAAGAGMAATGGFGGMLSGTGATGTGAGTAGSIATSLPAFDPITGSYVNAGMLSGAGTAGSIATSLPAFDPITGSYVNAGNIAGTAAGTAAGSAAGASGLIGSLGGAAPLLGTGLNIAGGLVQGQSASDAAKTQADAQIRAAQIAADAAKFRPVGVTTNFGSSQFGYDANGNLVSAGYSLNPQLQAQQQQLMNTSGGLLNQFTGAQAATTPMSEAAKTAMTLGQGYLATSPAEQAQKYMAEQQALLASGRERDLSGLLSKLQAQGRMGLATGATTTGMGAANPALEAYYNAQRQQDLELAAKSTQGGMDYAKFGAGMVGTGGDLLSSMYRTQSAAFDPYKTALGGAQTIEGLGQQAMDVGVNLGAKGTASAAESGRLLASGMTSAANTMAPANAWSPWGNLLTGAGSAMQQYRFDPMTGKAL